MALELFDCHYKKIFEKGNEIASRMIDFDYRKQDNYKTYDDKFLDFLKLYKQIKTSPQSDLFNLLIVRNSFFIDHYLKDFTDWKNKNHLVNHFQCLFMNDYENFILPQIEILKGINFD